MRHHVKNKDAHIMLKNSHSPIPQVQYNKKVYTSRNIERSDRARQFQNITGQLIKQIFHAVNNNILKNLPILREDVGLDEDIYGPSIPHLKFKTVRHKIQHVEPVKITSVTKTILDKYREVTIFCDLMYINKIGFLNTISRHTMFASVSMIKNRKTENIADGIMQVHKLYLQRGFKITHMHTDCEFKPLRKEMTALGIYLNCASKKEHDPEIDHFIWTVKERVRSTISTMPFNRISKIMIVHLVAYAIFWLNAFLPSTPGSGMSDTKGPGKLFPGNMVDYKKVCRIYPGEYVQVHQYDEP